MKKWITYVLIWIILVGGAFIGLVLITPPPPQPPKIGSPPEVKAVSMTLMNGNDGHILAEKEGDRRVYPASTTKILTCILALEEGTSRLDDDAVITERVTRQEGTIVGLRQDMPISLREVLYGMMLLSGNDAAVAVAETVGGYDHFIGRMNEKAIAIGAKDSHFVNPNGLTDAQHYTTANDMANMAAYAMKNPAFREIVRTQSHPMTYRDGMYRIVENRNELLASGYEGINGIKTGMTEAAGECLVASAERNGVLLIAAVYDDTDRWKDAQIWLDYGFAVIEEKARYARERTEEPILYRWVNEVTGKETHE